MDDNTKNNSCQAPSMADLAGMLCVFLCPADVAGVLGCTPYSISKAAETEEGRKGLGFPVIRIGTRTKIPRIPFLRFLGWEGPVGKIGA